MKRRLMTKEAQALRAELRATSEVLDSTTVKLDEFIEALEEIDDDGS